MYNDFMVSPERLIIVVALSLAAGWALGQYWRTRWLRKNQARLRKQAKEILREAKRTGQAKIVDAELEAKQILLEEYKSLQEDLEKNRNELLERERILNERLAHLSAVERDTEKARERAILAVEHSQAHEAALRETRAALALQLERVSGLSAQEAAKELLAEAERQAQQDASREANRLFVAASSEAERRGREVLISAIERLARTVTAEHTSCVVALPNIEMRGRVIGRDGRNVRAFESIAGVDLLVDAELNQVLLSCHDPMRREVARVAMVRLIEDGRIQPTRIENFIAESQQELQRGCNKAGQEALVSLEMGPVHPEVLEYLGKLQFRTSYAQNVLRHSVEAANIAGFIGGELEIDKDSIEHLRRAALFHDIGKAMGEEYSGTHACVGAELLRRCGEDELVVNAVAAHHGEVPDKSFLAPLLRAADALSGARPGARREDLDAYVKRLGNIESLALEFPGVTHAYALQAGRDLHVVVSGNDVADGDLAALARGIANAIERNMRFQGEVRVSVIREVRAVEYASWGARSSARDSKAEQASEG